METYATLKGQIVIPSKLRKKYGIITFSPSFTLLIFFFSIFHFLNSINFPFCLIDSSLASNIFTTFNPSAPLVKGLRFC